MPRQEDTNKALKRPKDQKQSANNQIASQDQGGSPRRDNFAATPLTTIDQNRGQRPIQGLQTPTFGAFNTLEDAQAAAQREQTQTGSVSPGTQAAIHNFSQQQGVTPQTTIDTGSQGSNTAYVPPPSVQNAVNDPTGLLKPLPTFNSQEELNKLIEEQVKKLEQMRGTSAEERLNQLGFDESVKNVAQALASVGVDDVRTGMGSILSGETNGSHYFDLRLTPEQITQLEEAGLSIEDVSQTYQQDGIFRVSTGVAGDKLNAFLQGQKNTASGQDIAEEEKVLAALKQQNQQFENQQFQQSFGNVANVETFGQEQVQQGVGPTGQPMQQPAVPTANVAQMAGVTTGVSGLPTQYQGITAGFGGVIQGMNQQMATEGSIYNAQVGLADQANAAFQATLNSAEATENALFNSTRDFYAKQQLNEEKATADAAANALARLQFQRNEETRRLRKSNDQKIKSQANTLALTGAAFSPSANKALADAEYEGEQNIIALRKEFGFKMADVDIAYTQSINDIYSRYGQMFLQEMKTHRAELTSINAKRFASEESTANRKQSALDTYQRNMSALQTQQSKEVKEENEKTAQALKDARAEDLKLKQEARENLVAAFQDFGAGSPFRKLAIEEAKAAGIDVSGLDVNEITIDQIADMKKEQAEVTYSPAQYDDPQAQAMMRAGNTVITSKLPVASHDINQQELKRLLDNGDIDGAKSFIENIVLNNVNDTTLSRYTDRKTVVDSTKELLKDLRLIQNTDKGGKIQSAFQSLFGGMNERLKEKSVDGKRVLYLDDDDFTWYNKTLQKTRNALGVDSDPQLKRIFARVENIASLVINERYGAAVTDGEMDRAREYIAMSGNTLGDMIIKLEEYAHFTELQNSQLTGVPIFGSSFGTDQPTLKQIREASDDAFRQMEDFGKPPDTEGLQSGVYDGRRVTLQPNAFKAFDAANRDFKRDHGIEIRIGAEHLSTFRDQKETIKSMADRLGVPFDASNPNATAQTLRAMGHPVANVGGSKHEQGLAVDLYPGNDIVLGDKVLSAHEYIALVKPYLERYGLKQVNHQGNDPGNFEYSMSS